MKRNLVRLLTFVAMLFALSLSGCEENKTETKQLIDGDESSDQFQAMVAGVEGMSDMNDDMLDGIFYGMDEVFKAASGSAREERLTPRFAQHDSVKSISASVVWNAGLEAWIVSLSLLAINIEEGGLDTLTLAYADTLTFFHGSTRVQAPNRDSVTQVSSTMGFEVRATGTLAQHGGITSAHNWTITAAPGQLNEEGDIVLDGVGACDIEFDFTIEDDGHHGGLAQSHGDCSGIFEFGLSVNDLAMNVSDVDNGACPTSGSIVWDGLVEVACFTDSGNFSLGGNSQVTATFSGDSATVVAISGDVRWEVSGTCDDGLATGTRANRSPYDFLTNRRRR